MSWVAGQSFGGRGACSIVGRLPAACPGDGVGHSLVRRSEWRKVGGGGQGLRKVGARVYVSAGLGSQRRWLLTMPRMAPEPPIRGNVSPPACRRRIWTRERENQFFLLKVLAAAGQEGPMQRVGRSRWPCSHLRRQQHSTCGRRPCSHLSRVHGPRNAAHGTIPSWQASSPPLPVLGHRSWAWRSGSSLPRPVLVVEAPVTHQAWLATHSRHLGPVGHDQTLHTSCCFLSCQEYGLI